MTHPYKYVNNLKAFLHAEVDGSIALISARRRSDKTPVVLACIKQQVEIPARVIGGAPTVGEQIIPIFEFVDTDRDNPYEAAPEEDLTAIQPSPILLFDPATAVRNASEAANEG